MERLAREEWGWSDQQIEAVKGMRDYDYERDFNLDKLESFCRLVADSKDYDSEIIHALGVKSGFFPESYSLGPNGPAAVIEREIISWPFENWDFNNYVERKFSTKQRRERAELCEESMEAGLPSIQYLK